VSLQIPWLSVGLFSTRSGKIWVPSNLFLDVFGKRKICIVVRIPLSEIARELRILGDVVPNHFGIIGPITRVPLILLAYDVIDLQIGDKRAFPVVSGPCIHEVIKMSDFVQETSSPVVLLPQIELLGLFQFFSKSHGLFEPS
jgi:hypothetical protein